MNWVYILVGLMLITSSVFAISNTGLKGYWNLNESSGAPADSSGNGSISTAKNIFYELNGKVGRDFNFKTASGSRVDLNKTGAYFMPANYTWCYWLFKIGATSGQLVTRDGGTTTTNSFNMSQETDNKVYFQMRNTAGTQFYTVSGALSNNAWHFICGSADNSKLYLWVDNVLQAPVAYTGTKATADTNVVFGGRQDTYAPLTGNLDEISFWDRNLSRSDVNDLYNAGAGVTYCPDTGTFALTCTTPSDPCAPTINQDWNINTAITCENKRIDLGTGKLVFNTGGSLKLYDSNIRATGIKMNGWGKFLQIFARSFLLIK
jgi:hypothetical protein